jgi:TetR/AcrR family transcriptional regulator
MPARAVRKRLSAPERETQILHAAMRAFARSNYRLAGTAEIASEAGIAEPTIYKYFPSKKDLFIRILKRIGERILDSWKAIEAEDPDPVAALRCIGRTYLETLRLHEDDLKMQFQALAESDDPSIARQLRENHQAYVRFFAELVERAKKKRLLKSDVDSYAAGWLLNGIGFTLTMARLLKMDTKSGQGPTESMILGYLDWLAPPRKRRPMALKVRPGKRRRGTLNSSF